MIKICALDFLNKESFETNVLTEDGRVLAATGDKITPGLLLKLYFKTIYVERELEESPVKIIAEIKADEELATPEAEPLVDSEIQIQIEDKESTEEAEQREIVSPEESVEKQEPEVEESVEPEISVEQAELPAEKITTPEPAEPELSAEETASVEKAEDIKIEPESVVIGGEKPGESESTVETAEEQSELVEAEAEQLPSSESKEEAIVIQEAEIIEVKGPKKTDTITVVQEESVEEHGESKGPRILDESEQPVKQVEEKKIYGQQKAPEPEPEPEPEPINPDEVPLKFNETQAKNIVEYSLAIGKMLNYSAKELKELEQVAYYSNIGINKFKQGDISKKSFRKMKALASYQKLLDEGTVPTDIAEIVKYSANYYEADIFPLNATVPYHHVVAITGYYEDMLLQGKSKDDILLKMLQLGGNQFNTFVLHKFINYMREKK